MSRPRFLTVKSSSAEFIRPCCGQAYYGCHCHYFWSYCCWYWHHTFGHLLRNGSESGTGRSNESAEIRFELQLFVASYSEKAGCSALSTQPKRPSQGRLDNLSEFTTTSGLLLTAFGTIRNGLEKITDSADEI